MGQHPTLHCPCNGQFLETTFQYNAPPAGETLFARDDQPYNRSYDRCTLCGHWFSNNPMDMSDLYSGTYVNNTYGEAMRQTFERIIALPPQESDNAGRVTRVLAFSREHFNALKVPSLLDVGSGLEVFPYAMKQCGWNCTALDPDENVGRHTQEVVKVAAVTGDFMEMDIPVLGCFDVVTFNKVIEHVEDPVAMLGRASLLIKPGGFVYLEVPDGEAAVAEGPTREEFFIEHLHVFSPASVVLLANRAGFHPLVIERLRESSRKFTLRAFLKASPL